MDAPSPSADPGHDLEPSVMGLALTQTGELVLADTSSGQTLMIRLSPRAARELASHLLEVANRAEAQGAPGQGRPQFDA